MGEYYTATYKEDTEKDEDSKGDKPKENEPKQKENYENKDDLELPLRTIPEVASNIFQAIENIKNEMSR